MLRPATRILVRLIFARLSGAFAANRMRAFFDLELRRFDEIDLALEQLLDIAQVAHLVRRDQRHRGAGGTRARRAADAMHVVFRHVRQLVVDHVRQLLDVEAASRHFRGHQRRDAVFLEVLQRLHARVLALVAVDGHGIDAGALQLLREAVRAMLGAREHQHLVPVALVDEMREQVALVLLRHAIGALLHLVGGGIARRHLHAHGVAQEAVGQLPDVVGIGCREHQVLALLGQHLQYALDVADEAHVEHAVRFVEDEGLHLAPARRRVARTDRAAGPAWRPGCRSHCAGWRSAAARTRRRRPPGVRRSPYLP